MPEIQSQTADTAAMAAIHQSLSELGTRTLMVEEMVQSQALVNERTAASLERIFGVLEKLQEDWTTERRAEKQPMKSPLSPMMPTPKSESKPLTICLDVTVESVESASTEIELASIDVINKPDSAVATSVFEDGDLCLDVSTIDSTQTEVTSDLFLADFSSVFVSSNAIIGEDSFGTKFCVSNTVSDLCLLPVCENDSANVLCLFVTKMVFVGNWCYIQLLLIAAKPPAKPLDISLNMLGQTNQVLTIVSKISCDMFKSMVRFTANKDATTAKCLVFVGLFISVYVVGLTRSQLALTECVKSNALAQLVVIAFAESIDEYGTHNGVGLKRGDKDEMSYYVRHEDNNQWLSAIFMRSESKLLQFIRAKCASEVILLHQQGARARILQGSCCIRSFHEAFSDFDFMMKERNSSNKSIIIIGSFIVMDSW
ncbi:hypothetical protein QQ045_010251 [Rhodiola kirilowii]